MLAIPHVKEIPWALCGFQKAENPGGRKEHGWSRPGSGCQRPRKTRACGGNRRAARDTPGERTSRKHI